MATMFVEMYEDGKAIGEQRRVAAALGALSCRADVLCSLGTRYRKVSTAGVGYNDFDIGVPAIFSTVTSQMGTSRRAFLAGTAWYHTTNSGRWEKPRTHLQREEDREFPVLWTTNTDGEGWFSYRGPNITDALTALVDTWMARSLILSMTDGLTGYEGQSGIQFRDDMDIDAIMSQWLAQGKPSHEVLPSV